MKTYGNIISYWRNSLADAMRMNLDKTKVHEAIAIAKDAVASGKVSLEITKEIFEKDKEGNTNGKNESSAKQDIDILICPIKAVSKVESGSENSTFESIITPLWIPAILTKTGDFLPKAGTFPWVPRTLLEPAYGNSITIGSAEEVDKFLTQNKQVPNVDDGWKALWEYSKELLEHVVQTPWDELALENYEISADSYIVVASAVQGTAKNIINLYDNIRKDGIPPLLQKYADSRDEELLPLLNEEDEFHICNKHLGQMNFKFPLSATQRQSIHHFLTLGHGQILAVNGPPGTGKTTLLQSVVASLWVEAAVKGEEPPVIVAASANNQAVTNIIDSFGNIEEPESTLAGRWLMEIKSYGLYCASTSKDEKKENEKSEKYQVAESFNAGYFPTRVENQDYVYKNKEFFIQKCTEFAQETLGNLSACCDFLHSSLLQTLAGIEEGIFQFRLYKELERKIAEQYQQYGGIDNYIASYQRKVEEQQEAITEIVSVELGWVNHFETEPWLLSLLSFLPPIKQKQKIRNRQYYLSTQFSMEVDFSSQNDILDRIYKRKNALNEEKRPYEEALAQAITEKKHLLEAEGKLCTWARCNSAQWDKKPETLYEMSAIIDTSIRLRAFKIATHYWECRWLLQMEEQINRNYKETKGKGKQQIKWRRYAKLTPCVVSTFYMIPSFFSSFQGRSLPLYDFIDLLIIDEAGQVTPEVAGASFSLAKRAIVVGDMQQIEPVWSINKKADIANLKKYMMIENEDENEIEEVFKTGMASSCGCVMKIAQRASKYQKFSAERGMFLSEHRRCFNEIIQYCNELAYKGRLEPMRGNAAAMHLPCMGHKNIKGKALQSGGSWGNWMEAQEIAAWIYDNKEILENYYSEKEKKRKNISEIIGVVTPFSHQGRLISSELKKLNLQKIAVGTVHTFQGAERSIILFSSVYDSEQKGKNFFFDRNVTMLNVAVSRAKDSFLVFGDQSIFDEAQTTPSGILAKYIKQRGI
jgi:hypothetical protein